MKDVSLLIFDWDGTLMDSAGHIVWSMQRAFEANEMQVPSDRAVRDIIGLGVHEALDRLIIEKGDSDKPRHLVVEAYREYYMDDTRVPMLFEGARETLSELSSQGYWLAVATGKSRRGLEYSFAKTGVSDFFITSRCADESRSKPHPEMLLNILEFTGLEASDALMIGDTTFDLDMASAIGMAGVAANYGAHPPERLVGCQPVLTLEKIGELSSGLANLGYQAAQA